MKVATLKLSDVFHESPKVGESPLHSSLTAYVTIVKENPCKSGKFQDFLRLVDCLLSVLTSFCFFFFSFGKLLRNCLCHTG